MKRKILSTAIFVMVCIHHLFFFPKIVFAEKQEDSPFGIHNPKVLSRPLPAGIKKPEGMDDYKDICELGAGWVRHAGFEGLVWDSVEKERGEYDWMKTDFIFTQTHKQGLRMVVSVKAFNRKDRPRAFEDSKTGQIPNNMDAFLEFLKMAVERYDGDGVDDAPDSPIVDVWQIENEVDGKHFWQDTQENYVTLLKESYRTIKQANPQAMVMIAGVATPPGFYEYYLDIFKELAREENQYFDIFDFHWSGQFMGENNYRILSFPKMDYPLEVFIADVKKRLAESGYHNIPIWITEMSDYEGKPEGREVPFEEKSESYQAQQIIKRYVYAIAHGVEKVFWVTLTEWGRFGNETNGYFNHVGLIHNPRQGGLSYKKLSYYTFQKMVEILGGSDWNKVDIVREGGGIYIYKFIKNRKPIWVMWNDNQERKIINLMADKNTKKVKITEAVAEYESGEDVKEYGTAFNLQEKDVQGGALTLTLGNSPVFVETQ